MRTIVFILLSVFIASTVATAANGVHIKPYTPVTSEQIT